jgi:hypothetical protein
MDRQSCKVRKRAQLHSDSPNAKLLNQMLLAPANRKGGPQAARSLLDIYLTSAP